MINHHRQASVYRAGAHGVITPLLTYIDSDVGAGGWNTGWCSMITHHHHHNNSLMKSFTFANGAVMQRQAIHSCLLPANTPCLG